MSDIPSDLKYTLSHEWVREEEDGTVTVGITGHAQAALGELVYVEVPEAELEVMVGDACAVVESVKSASDIYAPVHGTIIEGNVILADQPGLVNEQPYDDGWIMRIKLTEGANLDDLLDAQTYEESLEDE